MIVGQYFLYRKLSSFLIPCSPEIQLLFLVSLCFHKVFKPAFTCWHLAKKNTKTMWENCSKLIIKTPKRCQWRRSRVFITNFEEISLIVLVFPLSTWSIRMPFGLFLIWNSLISRNLQKKEGSRSLKYTD